MKISFVIPFHNEEKNSALMVEKVLKYAGKKKLDFEIIAVDDRSQDQTAQILRKFAVKHYQLKSVFRPISNEEKGNTMGKALVLGTTKARGGIIIWTMGDMADDVKTYDDIIRKLKKGADLVFGSRYMPGGSRGNLEPIKAYLSSSGTILARILFGLPVHDITNAFRGFKKSIFKKISLEEEGFAISPEFAIKAHIAGFKLDEVPTVYRNRVEGVSNFKLYKMTASYLRLYIKLFIKYKIKSVLIPQPVSL